MRYHSLSYRKGRGESVRVFKLKGFGRFQRRERISDKVLRSAVERAGRGLVDAELGGGLIKQRVATAGQGRSGGFRTIIAFRQSDRAFFLYGLSKSDQGNLEDDELVNWQTIGRRYLALDATGLNAAMAADELKEVDDDDDA